MAKGKGYIVLRAIGDGGPCAPDPKGYVKVEKPYPGETIYHGSFVPQQASHGQFDDQSMTVYTPVGEITSEPFDGGADVEVF